MILNKLFYILVNLIGHNLFSDTVHNGHVLAVLSCLFLYGLVFV